MRAVACSWSAARFGNRIGRKALAIHETSLGPDSPAAADALLDMSITSLGEGKSSLAGSQIRRALEILTETHGPEHTTVAVKECRLAKALALELRYPNAEKLPEHAVPILERTFPGGHPVLAKCRYQMGETAEAQHRWTEAAWKYQESIAAFERSTGPSSPALAAALHRYARLLVANRKAEARSMESRAREVQKTAKSLH